MQPSFTRPPGTYKRKVNSNSITGDLPLFQPTKLSESWDPGGSMFGG